MSARPGEGSLLAIRLLIVSSHGNKDWGALWGFFYKSVNPVHKASVLLTQYLPKASTPQTLTLGH